jgi:hypothetical protein
MMEKNFLLEDSQKYIESYTEWQKVLKMTGGDLSDPNAQKIYFPAYFHYTRVLFKMGAFDPRIKNRQKFIDAAAANIIRLEYGNTKIGWELTGKMYQELLKDKDSELLKKAYDALKAARKGASLRDPHSEFRGLALREFHSPSEGTSLTHLFRPSPAFELRRQKL